MRADKIWFNAAIQTLDPSLPTATALASKDGKIVAMGQDADVLHLGGPGTQSIDLGGRAVLPGFVESHTHALWGACQDLFEVNVNYGAAYGELIAAVKEHVARSSGDAMITGGPWRQYQPSGRRPQVESNDATAAWMCARSSSLPAVASMKPRYMPTVTSCE